MRTIDGFGAHDVAGGFYTGQRLKNLRFLMTDNTELVASLINLSQIG